jgi:hypothetical protein
VLAKNEVHTLTNVVIPNPTQAYLLFLSCSIQGFVVLGVVQTKERSYYDQHPTNQFLLFMIDVFGCLHKQANVFLHDCANAIWSLRVTWLSPFNPCYLFLLESIHNIKKDVSILQFKLSSSDRLSYFLTSLTSRLSPHPPSALLTCCRLLVDKLIFLKISP